MMILISLGVAQKLAAKNQCFLLLSVVFITIACKCLKSYQVNVLFLYPLKTENLQCFLVFDGAENVF